jgi:hypothetical protein
VAYLNLVMFGKSIPLVSNGYKATTTNVLAGNEKNIPLVSNQYKALGSDLCLEKRRSRKLHAQKCGEAVHWASTRLPALPLPRAAWLLGHELAFN